MRILIFCTIVIFTFTSCLFLNPTPTISSIALPVKQEEVSRIIKHSYSPSLKDSSYTVSRRTAILEVVATWDQIFNETKTSKKDNRRKNFQRYAEALVDSLRFFQSGEVESDLITKITGEEDYKKIAYKERKIRLPNNRYTHILIAYVVYKETSVNHTVVGKKPRFEVGLMQVWSKALQKYDRKRVKEDYSLGLFLGIRWLGLALQDCNIDPKRMYLWDWMRGLAYYGAGPRAKKDGICTNTYGFARRRVMKTIKLAKEISTM